MISFKKGDATCPDVCGNKIIVHCCNDQGAWGAGFVLSISRRWPEPESAYRLLHVSSVSGAGGLKLGHVQYVQVEPDTVIANLIGQHGYGRRNDPGYPFIRYDAVRVGLIDVIGRCISTRSSLHMPRLGCGLAGGTWDVIESIIMSVLNEMGDIDVHVYDQ